MNLRPIHDRLVVRRIETELTSAGGIVLALTETPQEPRGEVVSVGNDVSLSPGDQILFSAKAGTQVNVQGDALLVMRESDVIAVLS